MILGTMDRIDLLNVIRTLQKKVGDDILLEALESESEISCNFDPKEVAELASKCTDMDERMWYNMACRDEYGRYVDSGEHAVDVILENLREEFENDLKRILALGDKKQAAEFLNAIADGIEYSNGILSEEAPDFGGDFARHLRKCADRGKYDEAFDW